MKIEQLKKWMSLFTNSIQENKAYLSDLDTPIGDGDHGMNMARGTKAVMEALEDKNPGTVQDILKLVGMSLVSKVGGASGPLYGSAFIGMAKNAEKDSLIEILESGFEAIKKRGKSDINEKTMLDVWSPVIKALKDETLTDESIDGFANNTKNMKATKGRASYLGDRSIGHIDPGAMSSAYLFKTMLEAGVLDE